MLEIIISTFLVIFSLVIHEVGHWAFLARFNVPILQWWIGLGPKLFHAKSLRIGLFPLGGAVVPESDAYQQLTHAQRVLVALGGPLFSAIWAVTLLVCSDLVPHTQNFKGIHMLGELNLYIALLNLVPIPPLDGFVALTELAGHAGMPVTQKFLDIHARLGNGIVYGLGFLMLLGIFYK